MEMVSVGIVARSHGRRGHVVVNPLTDFPESRFRVGELVYTK
ncbi:MAG TPA: ribosome maturation factor RimM, partial [Acidobacteria bacterium]|nr:ribosome maturation factor RimM [Acidobacteriota bacterium]